MADTPPPPPPARDETPQDAGTPPPLTRTGREPLWRHMLGERLRHLRHVRGETLDQTARRAGISPQYLSEIERGVKEPSSEMIAAITGALDVTLVDLVSAVADRLVTVRATLRGPTCRAAFALAA
ncbi:helix-turn-helix transcriptional regulator [Promicromonospora sp. MEB111]|uniref:helix-turn-helix domain-containing protein n=1 Tax=Promicromonospora sp. MEB111 TaxID=3040301 RepID=UPI002550DBCE|nr:helix-turn-helix transcriptional regulator [Promicromonospora sp. MEB111]